ncbi:MAG: sugar transferase [Candidatus Omnitrophota bacterium]
MSPDRRNFSIRLLYVAIDVAAIYASFYLAFWIRKGALIFPFSSQPLIFNESNPFRFVLIFWIFVAVFVNNSHGLYVTRREIPESIEVWETLKSVFLSSLIAIVSIYLVKIEKFPRSVLMLAGCFMFIFFSFWRVCKRFLVEYLVSQGYNNFNVVIIGAGKIGTALAEEIKKKPGMGIKVVGFLDDFKVNKPGDNGPKILGKIDDFVRVARREFINKMFITIHHDSKVFLNLLEQAKSLNIAVRVIPQGFDLTSGDFSKYNIGFIPILEYSDVQQFRRQAGKRFFDFTASLLLSMVISPFFLLLALLIKLGTPGPVFYKSKRYGRGGKVFLMYKFRSMVRNADDLMDQLRHQNEADGPIFKIKKDPRITEVGRFLRKYSLDELPQIINVLRGEMSLVGPRPLPISQIEKEDLRQLKRLEVRPGITGLWQIRGRSDISFEKLVKWDIWYINNWSFLLDLNILLQTIPVVLKGQGAY